MCFETGMIEWHGLAAQGPGIVCMVAIWMNMNTGIAEDGRHVRQPKCRVRR